jgi:predicted HNH restriction endonuclease
MYNKTPNATIRGRINKLFLRSPERSEALKRDGYSCQECGVKQSKKKGFEQKVQVHHIKGKVWDEVIKLIREEILCDPKFLKTLCPSCHGTG